MASIQATRLKKGMLVKIEQDLFRVLELQHVTPGNLRGFVRVKFRNIRSGALADQKLRSEDSVERATLDEREMQYLYQDGDDYYFMDVVRHQPNQGWIEVIVGSMFSGKSEELIRRLRRAQIARQKVQIFKPMVDTRYADDHIVSHSEMRIPSRAVRTSSELLDLV